MREINDEQVVLQVGTKGNTQVPIANCFFIKKNVPTYNKY